MNAAALAWALTGAVRYAIATAIVALVLATLLPDTDGERFATTAYLAMIFAAVVLTLKWRTRGAAAEAADRRSKPSFPGILGFVAGVVILLSAGAGAVTDPRAELGLFAYCLAAVGAAAIGRAGALAWLHARIVAGGAGEATARYAAVVAAAALLLSAVLPSLLAEIFALLAYAAIALATALLAWLLAAPTPLGVLLKETYAETRAEIAQLSADLVFARMIDASVVTLIASVVLASLLRRPYSEPFATVTWIAGFFAAVGLAMECRRRLARPEHLAATVESPVAYAQRRSPELIEQFAAILTLQSVIRYSAFVTVFSFLVGASLLRHYAEPFVIIGYTAAVVLTLAVGLACHQGLTRAATTP